MDDDVSCPFCPLTLPPWDLQRHANSHFEDEDAAAAADADATAALSHFDDDQVARISEDHDICCLIATQIRSPFHSIGGGGLISLLCRCLQTDSGSAITLLSGYVDHFQCLPSEDLGWGCGWRNIQMLSSHLLSSRLDAAQVLFGGSGFVPDIPFLQRWLELAWQRGFDPSGALHFNASICGSTRWIGATECAALFRSFGLRVRIVDFGPDQLEPHFLSLPNTTPGVNPKAGSFKVYGPMDRYLLAPTTSSSSKSTTAISNTNVGPQRLLDWVLNYFSDQSILTFSPNQHRVITTGKAPLYFQHDGHSRTIVGIQLLRGKNGTVESSLLVLDPGHRTMALERSLKENVGWKTLLKRGVHTLRKPQYQLCYIDPGIATKEEMEQLKTIDSAFIKI